MKIKDILISLAIMLLMAGLAQAATYTMYRNSSYTVLPFVSNEQTYTFPYGLNVLGNNFTLEKNIIPTTHTLGIYPQVAEGSVWTNFAIFGANTSTYGRLMAVYGAVTGVSDYIYIAHNGTEGQIITGEDNIRLSPAGGSVIVDDNLTVADTATILNLKATNLESNLDATGYNITADNFNGNLVPSGDLDMQDYNITSVDCIQFISGGKICDSP